MRGCLFRLFWFLCCLSEIMPNVLQHYPPQSVCPPIWLRNGKVRKRHSGRIVMFICNTGYMLAGERFSICSHSRWDTQPPKCVRPTCMNKQANLPLNSLIYRSHGGAVLYISCKSGYQVRGPTEVHCDGRKWDNNMPVCMKTNTKPQLFCDFENEDLCGWSHDLNHDFEWRRENYDTPSGSIGTGPSFDHTKGVGQDGHYMFIESSSSNENDTAWLISPIFEKTDAVTCLEFFYHMYGVAIGALRVYVKETSQSWDLDPKTAIFNKRGNQGDKWYRSYHSLGVIDDEYQIVIEGIRGYSNVSDIAIDDVKIIENCVFEEITTTTEEYSYTTNSPVTVESCENRCGQTAGENETHVIPCDCDADCYDHNKCCPDYFDFCFVGSTNDDLKTSKTTVIDNNDVMEIPRPTNSDEELLLASPLPDVKVKIDWPAKQDIEDPRDYSSLVNFSEKDKSVKVPVSAGHNMVTVAISVLAVVVLATVVTIVLVQRYRGGCAGD